MRSPPVSWEKVCRPKKEGGLGLKNDVIWNKAAVGKLVWWLNSKPDSLWVRWVGHIYLKGTNWQDYYPKANTSWYWRKVCQVKLELQQAYQQQLWTNQHHMGYTVSKGYNFLRNREAEVQWHTLVWNKWAIPKHSFIAWVHHHGNMNTKEKLFKLGITDDSTCCICGGAVENLEHLFFACPYSKIVIAAVGKWVGTPWPESNWINWRLAKTGHSLHLEILDATINSCLYTIWHQRNRSRHEFTLTRPIHTARFIVDELKMRFQGRGKGVLGRREAMWLEGLLGRGV
ncbi:uncharacterized protein LOC141620125 [Silene latifolia]|uniref:uncharacterized protein LOC141620125 n=1 Tax=Silene latifolia TaxID=37657 RepID=UPI003D78A50A